MDAVALARLIPSIGGVRKLLDESVTHQVLSALADIDGEAAARALSDGAQSAEPLEQMRTAVTLLYSAYEKHKARAANRASSLADHIRAEIRLDKATDAMYRSALTALAIARIYQFMGQRQLGAKWRANAREDLAAWRESAWIIVGREHLAAASMSRGFVPVPRPDNWVWEHERAFEDAYDALVASDELG